jgi:tRNA(fMet)-specific endonuclease VapC
MPSVLPVLALGADSDRRYGANVMLIAAHALSLGLTLVTDNVDEFRGVQGLTLRNWRAG